MLFFRISNAGEKAAISKMTHCSPLNNCTKEGCGGGRVVDGQTPIIRKISHFNQLV